MKMQKRPLRRAWGPDRPDGPEPPRLSITYTPPRRPVGGLWEASDELPDDRGPPSPPIAPRRAAGRSAYREYLPGREARELRQDTAPVQFQGYPPPIKPHQACWTPRDGRAPGRCPRSAPRGSAAPRAGGFRTHASELVVFSSYEIEERAPYLGETRARIGGATWKRLDRTTVETLVGGKV